MDIIYTYWHAHRKRLEGQDKIVAVSNFYAQKNGHNTTLYTDSVGYKLLKNINFSNIVLFKSEDLNIVKKFWAGAKFVTINNMKSPFIHIDLDLFIIGNTFQNKIKGKNFFYFHDEPWLKQPKWDTVVYDLLSISKHNFDIPENFSFPCRNMAMFGTDNIESLEIIQKHSKMMLDFLDNNAALFSGKNKTNYRQIFKKHDVRYGIMLCVAFEQMLFPNLIIKDLNNQNIQQIYSNVTVPESLSLGYIGKTPTCLLEEHIYHLWGDKKNLEPIITRLLNKFKIKY